MTEMFTTSKLSTAIHIFLRQYFLTNKLKIILAPFAYNLW